VTAAAYPPNVLEVSQSRLARYPQRHGPDDVTSEEERAMLWTIFVILLVLWAVGLVSSYTLGGFIHILLIIAIAVVLIRIIQGRRPV
jgi:hypothetical protein